MNNIEAPSFLTSLEQTARDNPFATAIVTEKQVVDYARLNQVVWQVANGIANWRAAHPGTKTGVIAIHAGSVNHLTLALGVTRLGLTQLSIPDDITFDIVRRILQDSNTELLISQVEVPDCPVPQVRVAELGSSDANPRPYTYDPDALAQINLGSGTTGKQKLIPMTYRYLEDKLDRERESCPMEPGDRYMSLSPMSYSMIKLRVYRCLQSEAAIVIGDDRKESLLPFLAQYHVNHLTFVVPIANALLASISDKSIQKPRLPNLKSIQITSAPISEVMRQEIKTYLSPNLLVQYGTNEFGPASYALPAVQAGNPNCIGIPYEGVDFDIIDDDGNVCDPGVAGTVRLRRELMFDGYIDDAEESARVLKDGWYYPGDKASKSADGVIVYLGRTDDMIIFNGINIFPREIEYALENHPNVKEAAAFPLRNKRDHEYPAAAVILNEPMEVAELESYCQNALGVTRPRQIAICDDFPRNAAGKVLKSELREQLMSQGSA